MKILITGATGKLGGLVLDSLSTKTAKENIAVMLRNDKGAEAFSNRGIEVRIGNYDDTVSMVKAFKDIDKLYFISGPDLEGRLTQHKNVVAAAIEANVGHIIYTSFSRKGGRKPIPCLLWPKDTSSPKMRSGIREYPLRFCLTTIIWK